MFPITENRIIDGHLRMRAYRDAVLEAERLDFEAQQKREKTRPSKHNKLRGTYGQRK
jgi:hypothetical protein